MTDIIMIIIAIFIGLPLLFLAFLVEREGSKEQARRDAADKAWAEQVAWDEVYGCPGHSRHAPKDNELCETCKLVHRSDYLPTE